MRVSSGMRLTVLGALVALAGCEPDVVEVFGVPAFVLEEGGGTRTTADDAELPFGTVSMGRSLVKKLRISNTGTGDLTLQRVERVSGDVVQVADATDATAPFFVKFSAEQVIRNVDLLEVDVTFQPPQTTELQRPYASVLRLTFAGGRGGETASLNLSLTGTAISGSCDLPETLDFGPVARGDTFNLSVDFSNSQPLEARANAGTITGDEAFDYDGPSLRGNFVVPPNTPDRRVTLVFRPTEEKEYRATVKMRRTEGCPEKTVSLLGEGVESVLSWSPASLDFGFIQPNETITAKLTFENRGFKQVIVSDMRTLEGASASTLFRIVEADPGDTTKATVPPATRTNGMITTGKKEVTLSFRPVLLGRRSGSFRANTDLTVQPTVVVPMLGFGGGPDLSIAPLTNFNEVNLGRIAYFPNSTPPSSSVRRLQFANRGSRADPPDPRANLRLGKDGKVPFFAVTARAGATVEELCLGDWDSTNGTCVGSLTGYDPAVGLEAGAGALFVPFRVIPRSLGAKEWEVKVFSNDGDEPEKVLVVKALAVELPPCNATVSPTAVNFGIVTPPQDKTLGFSIRNNGTNAGDTCLVTNIELGPNSSDIYALVGGNVDEVVLGPGEQVDVRIRAWAQTQPPNNAAVGTVVFNISNPANPERSVSLLTTIGQGCLTMTPAFVNFGTVKKDCNSSERSVQVFNSCSTPITFNSVTMAQPAGLPAMSPGCASANRCPEFFATDVAALSGTMAVGGAPRSFRLRYRPIDFGSDTGAFVIRVTQSSTQLDYVLPLQGAGDTEGRNVDIFRQDSRQKADILFIIDNSCSMAEEQDLLSRNFTSFIRFAISKRVDFRMAVTTTDDSCTGQGCQGSFVASRAGRKILTQTTPNLEREFTEMVVRGTSGSGLEECLEPAKKALTAPKITDPAENGGFLRPDALLAVVCVTDAPDQSGSPPVGVRIAELQAVKGSSRRGAFEYHVIGPFTQPPPPGCSYDGSNDNIHDEAVRLTGGIKVNICGEDWGKNLERIGERAGGQRNVFYLTSLPDESEAPIEVTVDGVPLERTDIRGARVWEFDPAANSVNFEPLYVPEAGRDLRITYRVQCL